MVFLHSSSTRILSTVHRNLGAKFSRPLQPRKVAGGLGKWNSLNFYTTKAEPTETSLPEMKMTIGKWTVNYTQVGHGEKVVLGLPGVFGTIQTDFEPLISRFNLDKFTVVCWDPPGYGKSKLPQGFRKTTHKNETEDAETAAKLMENLGFKNYSLLAWSRGAVTAVRLLITNPGKIENLITWGAPAFIDQKGAKIAKLACNQSSWPKEVVEMYGKETFQEMLNDVSDYVQKASQTGSFQIKLLLSQIKVPTLILHGENDINCPLDNAQIYHKQIANSKLESWKNCSHFLHLEQPAKLVERVEKFILENK